MRTNHDRKPTDVSYSGWNFGGDWLAVGSNVNRTTWTSADGALILTASSTVDSDAMRRECQLLKVLASNGIKVPEAIETIQGEGLFASGGRLWRLTRAFEGYHPSPFSMVDRMMVTKRLALLHESLQKVDRSDLSFIPIRQSLTWSNRVDGLYQEHPELLCENEWLIVLNGVSRFQDLWDPDAFGMQIIHGDPSYPNILLGSNNLVDSGGWLDWESASIDCTLVDLAVTCLSVLRSNKAIGFLECVNEGYLNYRDIATGVNFDLGDLMLAMLGCKLESVAHHGGRFANGIDAAGVELKKQPELIAEILYYLK